MCRNKTTDEVEYQMWYAPEVKHWVKEWTKYSWGVQERGFESVHVRPHAHEFRFAPAHTAGVFVN